MNCDAEDCQSAKKHRNGASTGTHEIDPFLLKIETGVERLVSRSHSTDNSFTHVVKS